MKIGDLVKVGGRLRPSWYGEMGVIVGLAAEGFASEDGASHSWYRVALMSGRERTIRNDALVVINESW
jgi:hypothetical protein